MNSPAGSMRCSRKTRTRNSVPHPPDPLQPHSTSLPDLNRLVAANAPVLFVLLWSTGYIGAKYGLPYAEPFTLLFLRFVLALLLLAPLVMWLKPAMAMSGRERGHLMVSGLLLHGVYLGGE